MLMQEYFLQKSQSQVWVALQQIIGQEGLSET